MSPDGGTIACLIQDDPKSFSRRGLAQSNSRPTRSAREQPCQSQVNALDRHSGSTDWSPLGCARQRISLRRKRTTDFAFLPIGGRQIVFQLSARASKRFSYKAVSRPLRPNDLIRGRKLGFLSSIPYAAVGISQRFIPISRAPMNWDASGTGSSFASTTMTTAKRNARSLPKREALFSNIVLCAAERPNA